HQQQQQQQQQHHHLHSQATPSVTSSSNANLFLDPLDHADLVPPPAQLAQDMSNHTNTNNNDVVINKKHKLDQSLASVTPVAIKRQATSSGSSSRPSTWTKAEEDRLRVLVEAGTKWQAITKDFPHRTAGAIKKHYYADMKRNASWNSDEDRKLADAVREDEESKWKRIAEKVGKPAKACEKRIKELAKLQ
ncbi:hypothetical protein V1514DRAFT_271943, partial [Lipomyces japonicus]|uniref:uncharacterized protein n=1 Tax=Lipomyces japonicus TaxID=56871 RepID=UPI0034CF94DF